MAYFVGLFLSLAFEIPVFNLETLLLNKIMGNIKAHRHRKPPSVKVEFSVVNSDDTADDTALKEAVMKSCTDALVVSEKPAQS